MRDRERDPATGLGMATGRGPETDLGTATVGVRGSGWAVGRARARDSATGTAMVSDQVVDRD